MSDAWNLLLPDLSALGGEGVAWLGGAAPATLGGRAAAVLTSAQQSGAVGVAAVQMTRPLQQQLSATCVGHPMALRAYVWLGGGGAPAWSAPGALEVRGDVVSARG
jgi:hypothetical protein